MATVTVTLRFLQQQLPDTNFGYRITNNGIPITYNSGVNNVGKSFENISVENTGRINVSTTGNTDVTSFSLVTSGFDGIVNSVVIDSSGRYICGGNFTSYNGTPIKRVARINGDGSLDTTFNANLPTSINGMVYSLALMTDGTIVIGGAMTQRVMKVSTTGAQVFFSPSTPAFNGIVWKVLTDSSNNIYVGGSFTTYNGNARGGLVKMTSAGVETGAFVSITFNGTPYDMALDSSNKLVVVGSFLSVTNNGTNYSRVGLVRFTTSGNVDTSFNVGTAFTNLGGGAVPKTYSVAITSGGLIYVGGLFSYYNGVLRNSIVRILSTGDIDTSFTPGTGFAGGSNPVVYSVKTSGTDIICGGSFTSYNSTPANNIIKLNSTGGIPSSWNTLFGYNNTVKSIAVNSSIFAAVGDYTTHDIGAAQSLSTVPIGATGVGTGSTTTQTFVYNNLTTYNTNANIAYSNTSDKIVVTYTYTSGATIVIDNITDIDGYLEITVSDNNLAISPTIVMAKSPHIVTVPLTGTTNSCNFQFRMYTGDFNSDYPITANYSYTKQKIRFDQDVFMIDMAPLTKTFLATDLDKYIAPAASVSTQNVTNDVGLTETTWVSCVATTYAGTATTSTRSFKYLAIDGFGYTSEGVNPQPPKVLMTADVSDIWEKGTQRIYFNLDGLQSIGVLTPELIAADQADPESEDPSPGQSLEDLYPDGILDIPFDGSVEQSDEYIQSLRVNPTLSTQWVEYIFVYSGNRRYKKRFYIVSECKYDVKEVFFKNKYGFLQTMPFFKRNSKEISIETKTYERSTLTRTGTFDPRKHNTVTYLLDGKESYTLNSGFVSEYMNDVYQELILSDEIYLNDGDALPRVNSHSITRPNILIKPIVIKDKRWERKTVLNDKVINYTLKVEVGQNIINKIR